MANIQNITITATQTVTQPKPHTTYTVQIATPIRSWTIARRYNDFVALHEELLSSTGKAPPAALPPKHPWSITRSAYDQKIIRERRVLLETYLRAILTNRDSRWRQSYTFLDFLSVPQASSSTSDPSSIQWTSSNWLSEQTHIQTLLRNTRSSLLKRDALASMGDSTGSRTAGVEAKKILRDVGDKIENLEKGLKEVAKGLGDGEKRRREEMVEGLKVEKGDLQRMTEAGVRTNRDTSSPAAGAAASPSMARSTGGGGISGNMPGGMPEGNIWGPGPAVNAKVGRVFGQPQETSETRPLDDRGLLQLQQTKMDNQDGQLEELSKLLRRQRNMGEEIHREIGEQTDMLEDIEGEVGKVGGKMARAKRQMNKLG